MMPSERGATMSVIIDDFRRRSEFLQTMTLDFVKDVPEAQWAFSPHPRFAPFCKQLRHVVCVRGAYNDALLTKRTDFSKKHDHYAEGLTREELSAALVAKQDDLLRIIETVDVDAPIDVVGRAFSFGDFAYTMVQHEALHHGQWSIYASLAGFETPLVWRLEWGL
jgi:hypothetical protein